MPVRLRLNWLEENILIFLPIRLILIKILFLLLLGQGIRKLFVALLDFWGLRLLTNELNSKT
jgi:hypothetical protein